MLLAAEEQETLERPELLESIDYPVVAQDHAFTVSKINENAEMRRAAKSLDLKLELLCHRALYINVRGDLLLGTLINVMPKKEFTFEKITRELAKKFVFTGIYNEGTGELIYSSYRHDFCTDYTGKIFIDGGTDYIRSNVMPGTEGIAFVRIDLLAQRFWYIDEHEKQASEKIPFAYITLAEWDVLAKHYRENSSEENVGDPYH